MGENNTLSRGLGLGPGCFAVAVELSRDVFILRRPNAGSVACTRTFESLAFKNLAWLALCLHVAPRCHGLPVQCTVRLTDCHAALPPALHAQVGYELLLHLNLLLQHPDPPTQHYRPGNDAVTVRQLIQD